MLHGMTKCPAHISRRQIRTVLDAVCALSGKQGINRELSHLVSLRYIKTCYAVGSPYHASPPTFHRQAVNPDCCA